MHHLLHILKTPGINLGHLLDAQTHGCLSLVKREVPWAGAAMGEPVSSEASLSAWLGGSWPPAWAEGLCSEAWEDQELSAPVSPRVPVTVPSGHRGHMGCTVRWGGSHHRPPLQARQ